MALGNKNSETQASNDAAEPESTSDAGESSSSGNQSSDSIMDPSSSSQIVEGNEVQLICVGLMRTGLKTLRRALSELGYTRFYDEEDIVSTYELWDGVLRNREKDTDFSDIFRGAQVVMGMPTYCFWEQILERYPNARVILTVRHEDGWWESVSRAKALMDKELPGAPLQYGSAMRRFEKFLVPSYHKFCEILRFAWATTLGAHALESSELNEVSTRSSYRRHNSYVKSALAKQRTASGQRRLLVYNVCEGWAPLCKFLHKAAPEEHFPAVMTVPYFLRDAKQHGFERQTSEGGGQEFEEFMVPDSDFGVCMRKELRRGLAVVLSGLAFLAAVVLVVHQTSLVEVPVAFVAFIYLAVMTAAWQAYVVMHGLVMRVPTLVVLPMALKSFLIASCLQGCFITYGVLKEMIVTQDRIASPVLILSARLMSVICGASALLLTEGRISFGGAPLYSFSAFGFTNEASTWAGYEMLKYVSFPVQVMAKSCKLLPNMIMGKMLNGTQYKWSQYFQAVGAMVCVTIMHLSDENEHKCGGDNNAGAAADNRETSELVRMVLGIGLLVIFFACDSFTSQWQTALYKKHRNISQTQMMLAGNLAGVLITMGSIVSRWSAVRKSIMLMAAKPEILVRVLALGLSGAMGQFCIYTAIKVLGPLAFTWIMTSRQLCSVLISLVMFGHGVNATKLLCILTVFAIMSSKQLSRAVPAMRQCSGCRARFVVRSQFSEADLASTPGPFPNLGLGKKRSAPMLHQHASQVWEAPTPASKKSD